MLKKFQSKSVSASVLKSAAVIGLSQVLLTGCVSSTSMGYGADRSQFMLVSQEHVVKKADKRIDTMFTATKSPYLNSTQHRVVNIMNTLTPYAEQFLEPDQKVDWDVYVYEDIKRKAFAGIMANGTIAISYSMINHPSMATDDALAFLIAHELAHVVRQHHRERTSWNYSIRPVAYLSALFTMGTTSGLVAGSIGDSYVFMSRKMEKEADLLGLEIMAQAGYNPEKAVGMFKEFEPTFKKQHPILSKMPPFMLTHPSIKKRTNYSLDYLPNVMPMYNDFKDQPRMVAKNPIKPNSRPAPTTAKTIVVPNRYEEASKKIEDQPVVEEAKLQPVS